MASKMILERVKSDADVRSAGHKFVLNNLGRFVQEVGPGQDETVGDLARGALARLEADRDAMVAADAGLSLESSQDAEARARIDKAAGGVREVLVPGRQTLSGMYGTDYVHGLGFDGPTPDDPVALLHVARTVSARLAEKATPASRFGAAAVDPKQLLAPLPSLADELEAALRHGKAEKRETQVALENKRAAIARFDRSFAFTANLMSTFLDLIGERELARKVRPSTRRPGNTVSVAGGESEPELPEPPAEPEAPQADGPAPVAE